MFNTQKNESARAEIKGGALVLYLPKALKPCVWRMDLEILSETSIEIDEKDNVYVLATRDINGVSKAISGFNNKEDAEKALSLTLKALMAAEKNESNFSLSRASFKPLSLLKWIIMAFGIFFVGSVVLEVFNANLGSNQTEIGIASPQGEDTVTNEVGELKVGVPVDVDSFFENIEE